VNRFDRLQRQDEDLSDVIVPAGGGKRRDASMIRVSSRQLASYQPGSARGRADASAVTPQGG
jgi:hypothetical protein